MEWLFRFFFLVNFHFFIHKMKLYTVKMKQYHVEMQGILPSKFFLQVFEVSPLLVSVPPCLPPFLHVCTTTQNWRPLSMIVDASIKLPYLCHE